MARWSKNQAFVRLPFNEMNHWPPRCFCQMCSMGEKSRTAFRGRSKKKKKKKVSPESCLADWNSIQLANLRMLLRSLLLYSLWSTGRTSMTVTFTRLSSWGGKENVELSAATADEWTFQASTIRVIAEINAITECSETTGVSSCWCSSHVGWSLVSD